MISAQCSECQSEEIQSSAGKRRELRFNIITAPGMQIFFFLILSPEDQVQLHVNTYLDAGKSLEPFSPNLIGKLIRLSGSCTTGDRKKDWAISRVTT